MKKKSIALTLFLATGLIALTQCGNKKDENHDQHDSTAQTTEAPAAVEASAPQFTVDAAFQQQLSGVLTSYLSLKDAFVSSDAVTVKVKSSETTAALAKADMMLLTGPAHHDWMTYLGSMETALKEIQASDDLKVQRKAFSALSDGLYKSIKAYGLGGATAYYDFCPMAFDNLGGFWLSGEEKIQNPYFGADMLTCGEVKEKLN